MKILMIDSDPLFLRVLAKHLEGEGYETVIARTGREGLRLAFAEKPDMVLLDMRMPDMSGHDACIRLHELCQVPVIFLSAVDDEDEIVRALRCGADDYLVKPFSVAELKARLRAVMRRASGGQNKVPQHYEDDSLTIDLGTRRVYKRGRRIDLSPTELRLLAYLLERRGQVVPHDEIISAVWGDENRQERYHHLSLYMSYLRKKLEDDPKAPRYLRTRYGQGYWFSGPYDPDP